MLQYVHQLVVNCVCLPFGAQQAVYSGFLELLRWKQLLAVGQKQQYKSSESEPKQVKQRAFSS